MRSKSTKTNGYIVYAISGTNTVSFAIDFRGAATKGLLGFAVERLDKKTGERKYADGFKVFKGEVKNPNEDTVVSTYTHPVQSFVWDDFACYDDREYEYFFYPVKGKPNKLDRSTKPIMLNIKTEPAFSKEEHDVFFNRGVASSQAYHRKFFNLPPDKITDPNMQRAALNWLSRQLDDAILRFIGQAKKGDTLLGCFYEFRYAPVVQAFKDAIGRGVKVKLIIDAKENEHTDSKKKFHESFPRQANLETLAIVGIPASKSAGIIYKREANKNAIQHNKFIVLLQGGKPTQVWTGSTNISLGGVHGQTNVGHWVRNRSAAKKYMQYWELLSKDPGGHDGDDAATVKANNAALKKEVEKLQPNITFKDWNDIPVGITPVFSPRSGKTILESYVKMMDAAEDVACITLAFGINELYKDYLEDNTNADNISFMLLEKEDKANKKSKKPFRYIGAKQNVYKSWGAYIKDDLYQWAKETSTRGMKLNEHVAYIHSKFLLVDPLGDDPVVVTGSANFSVASTNTNDENMIIIRGNKRVADIYFTEFNRLFNHYYFRSVYNKTKEQKRNDDGTLFLCPDDKWMTSYKKGKLRFKRMEMFTKMKGF